MVRPLRLNTFLTVLQVDLGGGSMLTFGVCGAETPVRLTERLAMAASILALSATGVLARPDACSETAPGAYLCVGNQSQGVNIPAVGAGDPPLSTSTLSIRSLTTDLRAVGWTGGADSPTLNVNTGDFLVSPGGLFVDRSGGVPSDGATNINLSGAGIKITDTSIWSQSAIYARRAGNTGSSNSSSSGSGGAGARGGNIFLRFNPNDQGTVDTYGISLPDDSSASAIYAETLGGAGGQGGQIGGKGGTGGAGGLTSIATNTDVEIDTAGIGIEGRSIGGPGPDGRNGQGFNGGGDGGVGGTGGTVALNGDQNGGKGSGSWTIATSGVGAHGVSLLSKGGDGGDGGEVNSGGSAPGGSAREGGDAGQVLIWDSAPITVTTTGANASGILARSEGGDGGTGGDGSLSAKDGSGGSGGNAFNATVDSVVDITTTGFEAAGIAASALGGSTGAPGGGGKRTFAATAGTGGQTTVNTLAGSKVETSGDLSVGISAQSIGGFGADAPDSNGLVNFAATGGSGGFSALVFANNAGDVTTRGFFAPGILAAGLGGGGGHGGDSFGAFYSQGGGGSHGGQGGLVDVTNTGTVQTGGASSTGILAQSIGGTGGAGGSSGGLVALGGGAAIGGDGAPVTVNQFGTVNAGDPTLSNGLLVATAAQGPCLEGCAPGVLAQSIGGGGGQGGTSAGWFSIGGGAGGGGNGGQVTVNLGDGANPAASITTHLDDSDGVGAHSIGGGGGNGGNAFAVGLGVSAAVGGSGGGGGDGDQVVVTQNKGAVSTAGARSHGVNAQSIGGGGGNGGFGASVALGVGVGASAAVGGGAGRGGTAGVVRVTQTGGGNRITTQGDESNGILAQSIGGGGGSGGFAVTANGSFSPTGGGSVAISAAVGGAGGAGGTANEVSVTSDSFLSTEGDRSTGILAQSIGGGGGNGGLAVAGSFAAGEGSTAVSVGVGGGAGAGGAANAVSVSKGWALSTEGTNADGIVAQSIGGGGGNGGGAIAGSATISGQSTSVDVAVGGGGGNGGQGGAVDVTFGARPNAPSGITTTGDLSDAIVAQSIGGGGGNGGFAAAGNFKLGGESNSVNVSIGGSAGSGASSDAVTVTTEASQAIQATGNAAKGILAQSIAGGGGNGGMAITGSFTQGDGAKELAFALGAAGGSGGTSGAVRVTSGSPIVTGSQTTLIPSNYAAQQGGNAIVAQSIGGSGGTGGLSASASKNSGSASQGNTGDRSLTVDIGGSGGGGGATSFVRVDVDGSATTLGHLSDAVIAQSIGGSGGAGGGTINYEDANKNSKALNLAVGGAGGGGAAGQGATVSVTADIVAWGAGSRGVVVQSIGGNGGSGGANHFSVEDDSAPGDTLTVGIGGSASSGSAGGTARFQMLAGGSVSTGDGLAATREEGSQFSGHAVTVQSVGGGGGVGGAGITGNVQTKGGDNSKSFNLGLGGQGAAGGDGGDALVFAFDTSVATPIEGTIATTNWNSHGLFVQSVGGGGGDGGTGIKGDVSNKSKLGLNIGLGAGAGGGGAGGEVRVLTNADVTVDGDGSKGLFAQSVGGGGGNGGLGINGDVTAGGGEGTKQLTFGLGATGAGGGEGGDVTVANGGGIATAANASSGAAREMDAIFAQSIGGGGGNGGIGINGDVTSSDGSGGLQLTLGIGLSGGAGGDGGVVDISNSGALSFAGESSRGILAQSIGGGGGNGGAGIVGDLTSASDKKGSTAKRNHVNVGLGAAGADAGRGQGVTVSNTGSIAMDSASSVAEDTVNATGILAQSIGGGGGNSGIGIDGNVTGTKNTRVANIGIGGVGGAAGDDAGAVSVTNGGAISIFGDAGRGIHAQSIGGGGGNGALGISGTVATGSGDDDDENAKGGKAISFGLGGEGGEGADGAAVLVTNTGAISTGARAGAEDNGDSDAHGVHAQSIGGGGGTGVITGGLVYGNINDEDTAKGIAFSLGATGGGGNAGTVTVDNAGAITTNAASSHAIYAQSIGGGGGNVGSLKGIATEEDDVTWGATVNLGGTSSSGFGGAVNVQLSDASSDIATTGPNSHGVLVQSIGGGGGSGASGAGNSEAVNGGDPKIAINLGGQEGAAGNGGAVTVGNGGGGAALGSIATDGNYAVGILAQSIGGGGGLAGENVRTASGSVLTLGASGASSSVSSNGGNVRVDFAGDIETELSASHGIFAQSIGGGGGYGGQFNAAADSAMGTDLDMGSDGTANGDGGAVGVYLDGATLKTGQGRTASQQTSSIGVFAQSVGGGGGVQGDVIAPAGTPASIGSAGGKGGSTRVNVFLENGSSIETSGRYSHGVVAQAASGTSVSTGFVNVVLSGGSRIDATGIGAAGIIAQTTGNATNINSVEIDIDATSSVTGGLGIDSVTGASNSAIWVRDGNQGNQITNAGKIESANGSTGIAVKYTGSSGLTVTNTGTIIGNFVGDITEEAALASASVTASDGDAIRTHVVNEADGEIFLSGDSSFDRLTNRGYLAVDESDGGVALSNFTGSLLNESGGILAIDLGLTSSGLLASDAFLSNSGTIHFEFGSLLSLSLLDSFRFETGSTFNLLGGLDLWFEGEEEDDFSFFDYVDGDFLDDDWEFSIDTLLGGAFPPFGPLDGGGSLFANSVSNFEVLSVTYVGDVAPVPLPAGFYLYTSLLAAGGGVAWLRRRRKQAAPAGQLPNVV